MDKMPIVLLYAGIYILWFSYVRALDFVRGFFFFFVAKARKPRQKFTKFEFEQFRCDKRDNRRWKIVTLNRSYRKNTNTFIQSEFRIYGTRMHATTSFHFVQVFVSPNNNKNIISYD